MTPNYIQLVQPNLNIVGVDGECLVYVREINGAPPVYPTALVAWQNTQYKHAGSTPPSNISVPIWFDWETDGHVAEWAQGKIYSTTAQGDKIFSSIQNLMDYIGGGIEYLGWSEDINNARVVEPQEVNVEGNPNAGDVTNAYAAVGETAQPADIQVYINKPWNAPDGLYYGKTLVDLKNLQNALAEAQNASYTPYSGAELYIKS